MNTKKKNRQDSDCDSLFYWGWDDEVSTGGVPIGDADVTYNRNNAHHITGSTRLYDNTLIKDCDNMKNNKIFRKL